MVQASGGPSVGWLLQGLGRRLTGKKVMRFWPDNGGWWEAEVHNYNASTGQHRFVPCPTHAWSTSSYHIDKFLQF